MDWGQVVGLAPDLLVGMFFGVLIALGGVVGVRSTMRFGNEATAFGAIVGMLVPGIFFMVYVLFFFPSTLQGGPEENTWRLFATLAGFLVGGVAGIPILHPLVIPRNQNANAS